MKQYLSNERKISLEEAREKKFKEFVKKSRKEILEQIAEETQSIQDYQNDLDALTDALFVVTVREDKV